MLAPLTSGLSKRHLDEVDPADEVSHQAGEDGGEDVKEDEEEQIAGSLAEIINLLPLEIVTFHIAWGREGVNINYLPISISPRLTALGPS